MNERLSEEGDEDEDDDYEEDELELNKAEFLVYGSNSQRPMLRGKQDPDFPMPTDANEGPFQPIDNIRDSIDNLYTRLEHLDTNYDVVEDKFNHGLEAKTMEIE